MDNQRGLLLNWTYNLYQEKREDELRQSLAVAMEIEQIRLRAQDELKMRDLEITQLKAQLSRAIKERDEARENCRKACLERALLRKQKRHQSAPRSGISTIEDGPRGRIEQSSNGFSSSDCDESIGSSPPRTTSLPLVAPNKPLPEKGKLLQAVVKAGPLLQTLLLAGGPLPQWRHPPPRLDTYQVPPPLAVSIHQELLHGDNIDMHNCGKITRKESINDPP